MFTENFYIGIEAGMLQKEAFVGSLVGGTLRTVGKGAWKTMKFPFSGFKNQTLNKADKIIGMKNMAGVGLFSAPFAALGAHQYASRAGRSTVKAYNPTRKNLLSPVTQKSPMGNIF